MASVESKDLPAISERTRTAVSLLREAVNFLCATFGLVVLVAVYAAAGGGMFAYLEQTNEKSQCEQERVLYKSLLNDTLDRIKVIRAYYRAVDDEVYAETEFLRVMRQFRDQALSIGYDGEDCDAIGYPGGPPYQWSFASSMLFACTIFTTIGYGNIAPRTFWGRIVCIAYAMVGIPLMLICLSNIGEFLSKVFQLIYVELFCFRCFRRRKRPLSIPVGGNDRNDSHQSWKTEYISGRSQNTAAQRRTSANYELLRDAEESDESMEEENVTVPLTVTLVMMGWYVFFGALIFSVMESWDWMQSGYYCFVTISTIGFGDVVPGVNDLATTQGQLKMIGAALYLLIGMALLSMTFNLLQEEMAQKTIWIAEKLKALKNRTPGRAKPTNELTGSSVVRIRASRSDDVATGPLQMIYLDDQKAYLSLAEYHVRNDPGVPKRTVVGRDRGKIRRQPIERLLPNLNSVRHGEGGEGEAQSRTESPINGREQLL